MTRMLPRMIGAVALALAFAAPQSANAEEKNLPPGPVVGDNSGVRDFDFLMGDWRVHHRIKRPLPDGEWSEFEGTCTERPLMDGRGNVEEHRFERPAGATYGIAIRAHDPNSAEWAIWWIDSRAPHGAMDPPMKGRFENGIGTFYSDSTLEGKPIRVRFLWTSVDKDTAHWEQAYSADGGKTWEVNWIMDFRRV